MNQTAEPSQRRTPNGHAFPGPVRDPVAHAQDKLLTAYRPNWGSRNHSNSADSQLSAGPQPDIVLRGDYEEAMADVGLTDESYQTALYSLLRTFPQGEGEVPERPKPQNMETLFKKVSFHPQTRNHGKGSKGGVKHCECKWPACDFKGPMQKCMDHFFSEHIKLKFFKCDQPNCIIAFTRKYDLDKHKKKQHAVSRPRERRSQVDEGVAVPSRQTRSSNPHRHQPYPTQGRVTRGRPAHD